MNILRDVRRRLYQVQSLHPVVAWTHSKSHRIASYHLCSLPRDIPNKHISQTTNPLAVAPARALSLVSLRPQVDALSLLARSQVPGSRLIDRQFLRDSSEELLYVLARLGGRLEEEEAGFVGVLLGVGGGDSALVGGFGHEIELVAGEGDDDVLVGLALEFFDPGFCLV